jgi:hypothetical protein
MVVVCLSSRRIASEISKQILYRDVLCPTQQKTVIA